MGLNVTKKILKSHLLEGSMLPNEQITIKVDQTLGHDLTGIMAAQILESVQAEKVSTETSVFYCDHNVIAASSENTDDHMYLKTCTKIWSIFFKTRKRHMSLLTCSEIW